MHQNLKTLNDLIADNPNILDFVTVPESAIDLNETALKQAIIRRCGDVEPYYQKPLEFQLFGTLWFNSHSFLFAHALAIWNATYNPIENYDRTETETINDTSAGTRSGTDTHSGTDTTTTSGSNSNTDTHSGTDTETTSGSRENDIAGFDSSGYEDANRETTSETKSTAHGETITSSGQNSGSEAVQHGHSIATEEETTGENERSRSLRVHGNIGVTTSQQMLEAEMELARRFWVYDYIASAFESDNFLTCYKAYYEGEQWN